MTTAFTAIPEKMTRSTSRFFGFGMMCSDPCPGSRFQEPYLKTRRMAIDLDQGHRPKPGATNA